MSRAPTRAVLVAVLAGMSVMLTGGNAAALIEAPITLDAVKVENGVAIVTGTVDDPDGLLQINGAPVQIGDSGDFLATVNLSGDSLELELLEEPGELVELTIPLNVLLATGGQGVLDQLLGAGIQIDVPEGGFQIVDGQLPVIEGRVLHSNELAALSVNGVDVLRVLGPDRLFSIALPGSSSSTERVTVVASDRSGVTQTSTFMPSRVSSTIATRAGTSVSAAGAQGIRITKLLLNKRFLKSTKQLRLAVTVKDRRGYLIRGASLRMQAMPAKHVANGAVRAGFTNRVGQVHFGYRMKPGAFRKSPQPKYLTVAIRASTPAASAAKRLTFRLPIQTTR